MAKIERTSPGTLHKPVVKYSHVVTAVSAQKLVFCAGQVAIDTSGNVLPPEDFDAQKRLVMENLQKALAAGGATLADVTKITVYLVDPNDIPKARTIYDEYFASNPPASTMCVLRSLAHPSFRLEIEAFATV